MSESEIPVPPEPKAGWRTSEFWQALVPSIVGLLMTVVALARNDQSMLMLALGILGLGAIPATGYASSRSKVKTAHVDAQARYAEAVAKKQSGGGS